MRDRANNKTTTTAVIGLQYGDEGKGQIVDWLSAQHDTVVRYNGGANAGHSVSIGNEKFVLHQVPIGVLTAGKTNVLANGMVISVDLLLDEMNLLRQAGIDLSHLKVSNRAHVVMPYHLQEEKFRHELTTRLMGEDLTLGTTFKGIGPCYADKAARDTAVRIEDLYHSDALARRLNYIVTLKNATLAALAQLIGKRYMPIQVAELVKQCSSWATQLEPHVCDTSTLLNNSIQQGAKVLFEGANAAMLDVDHGTYPFVTSSNGSTLGIASGTGLPTSMLANRIGVAKAYMSRVGTGPFVTELHGDIAERLRLAGSEFGSTTGRPRRIGWLDLPALKSMAIHNDINAVVVTGLSVLETLDSFRVCTGYSYQGRSISALPASVETMNELVPIYADFDVSGDVHSCRSLGELPEWAQEIIRLISGQVSRVSAVCVGKRRDQILWLKKDL